MSEEINKVEKPKHRFFREETNACDWSVVYKEETETKCLPFGCYWYYPLPACE